MEERKYYEAYDERYKTVQGLRIWMSEISGQSDNKYAIRMVLGLLGCILLAVVLSVGGAILSIKMEGQKELISVLSLILTTVLVIWGALRLGKLSIRDTLIFCKDVNDTMYVLNLRDKVRYRKGLVGYASMVAETERLQTKLRNEGTLEQKLKDGTIGEMACEIISVKNIKVQRDGHSVVCRIKYPGGRCGNVTYQVSKGFEQEDELLHHLERRWQRSVNGEIEKNPYPVRIFASAVALICVITICVCSHPAVAVLPEAVYFPCLGISVVPLWLLLYYVTKMRRGE